MDSIYSMGTFRKLLIGVGAISVMACLVSIALGKTSLSGWLGAPSVVISAWTFGGHLVTLDDDFPGGWSNQEGSRSALTQSLWALAFKALVLLATSFIAFVLPEWW
jgi:hypothetical protein